MPATGNEVVKLSQLKTYADGVNTTLSAKLNAPASEGSAGQVLTTDGAGTVSWSTVSASGTYTATLPISITGTNIAIAEAGDGSQGTVAFASDADFNDYLGIS